MLWRLLAKLRAAGRLAQEALDAVPLLKELAENDYGGAWEVAKGFGTMHDAIAEAEAILEQVGVPGDLAPQVLDAVGPFLMRGLDALIPEEQLLALVDAVT